MSIVIIIIIIIIIIIMDNVLCSPCGGGLEYLHRSPASRRRQLDHLVTGGEVERLGPTGWGLGAWLTTLLCKKESVQRKPKKYESRQNRQI
jgi:hypothetical protein